MKFEGFDRTELQQFSNVQNLAYDRASGNFYMAVYKGRKKDFPNYSLFVADGSANPQKERLQGFNPEREGEVIPLLKAGKRSKGIYGWDFNLGACGLCPLGDGYFYIAHNRKGKDGQQSCTARLYKWTGNADNPRSALRQGSEHPTKHVQRVSRKGSDEAHQPEKGLGRGSAMG